MTVKNPSLPQKRREPLTDTQLLMTITICIFVAMYVLAMLLLGGGFLRAQQIFDLLNDNAALIIVACGLTVVMIGGGIDISVGGVTSLVVMSCVLYLNNNGNIFVSMAWLRRQERQSDPGQDRAGCDRRDPVHHCDLPAVEIRTDGP